MKSEIVKVAEMPPGRCIVTGSVEGEFIDTKTYASEIDPYIYLHVPYVKEVARDLLGMVDRKEVEKLEEQVNALRVKLEQQTKVEEAVKTLEEFTSEKVMA